MGLFSGQRDVAPPPVPPRGTHTNAPAHWPPVALAPAGREAVQILMLGAALHEGLKAQGGELAFLRHYVYEDGILEIPLVIREGDTTSCVFTYLHTDRNAAAHFAGARAILEARETVNVVYYAFEPLGPAAPATVLRPIDTPMFGRMSKPPADARYSLWWATPDDPVFTTSPDRALIDRWFESLDGYGYLLLSSLVRLLELMPNSKKDELQIVRQPEQPFLLELVGPADTPMLLHASAPLGFFFAFDEARVSVTRRRAFLRLLADFASGYRAQIDAQRIAADPAEQGLAVWRGIREEALAKEAAGATDLTLHGIAVAGGQTIRAPHARSASDRAQTPRLPAADVIGFALDAIDKAAALLQQVRPQASTAEKLGGPNVDATILVRADGRTWQRVFPFEDISQVMAAAAAIREDWPTAETVAVLMDAAVRDTEGGERVDVLRAIVQGPDGVAADTFQRYVVDPAGSFRLTGRPTVTPMGPFVPPPAPPPLRPYGQPDAELGHMVRSALRLAAKVHATPSAAPPGTAWAAAKMPTAMVDRGREKGDILTFAMNGPLGSLHACRKMLATDAAAAHVVFWVDDIVLVDGIPDRRIRLYAQRRGDPAAAIFDQRFTPPADDQAFAFRGQPAFVRWTDSLFP